MSFNKLAKKLISLQKLLCLFNCCDSIIGVISQLCIFLLGGYEVINGNMTIGSYVIMANYFSILMSSSRYFFNLGKNYQENLASYNRIMYILKIPQQKEGYMEINNIENIKISKLTFNYREKNIYKNYNVEFEKGKIYSIIGHNGVGKSTLINIIFGLYLNDHEGKISYNNIDINDIDMYKARLNNLGLIEQEPILIGDSLINNITLEKNLDIELINKYISIFGLDNYILSLKNGLDTVINEKSSNISGGEKQRIAILRQAIKDPDVMIFDEPTSALDLDGKIKFKNYLKTIKNNKIIIVISHDNHMNDIFDEIIDLNNK